jgi:predicted nucleotidyltransferase
MNKTTVDFIEELKNDPNVIGVIMFGSWARGNNREDSDVDLVVLLNEGYKRAIEEREGQVFEIIYTTPNSALKYWEDHKDDCAGLWAVAKTLYSKNSTVETLEHKVTEMLEAGKSLIPDTQLKQTIFDKKDKLKYIKAIYENDSATANMMLFNTASELTEVFFDVRQKWTPAPKQRLKQIAEIDSNLEVLIREFYAEHTTTTRRLELLEQMITLVFN